MLQHIFSYNGTKITKAYKNIYGFSRGYKNMHREVNPFRIIIKSCKFSTLVFPLSYFYLWNLKKSSDVWVWTIAFWCFTPCIALWRLSLVRRTLACHSVDCTLTFEFGPSDSGLSQRGSHRGVWMWAIARWLVTPCNSLWRLSVSHHILVFHTMHRTMAFEWVPSHYRVWVSTIALSRLSEYHRTLAYRFFMHSSVIYVKVIRIFEG
jgi:hypothetical protein